MSSELSRRDFLKLLALLPLLKVPFDLFDELDVEARGAPQNPDAPNILILVFDACSATNLSLYGYPRDTTPNLRRFAGRATVFNRHHAGGSFTSPGTASLLTGTYPWSHRAFHVYGRVIGDFLQQNLFSAFPAGTYNRMAYTHNDLAGMLLYQFSEHIDLFKKTKELALYYEKLLADGLLANDHNVAFLGERAALRGQSNKIPSTLFLSTLHRMWRTNERNDIQRAYKDLFPRGVPSANAAPLMFLLEDAIDWIEEQISRSPRPFVGYFHMMPPHEPYNTRREFYDMFLNDGWRPPAKPAHHFSQGHSPETMEEKRREYDEFIAYADAEFGRLYDFMEEKGLLENTYLVVTSDHGEMFERGILEHVTPTLYEPLSRIPLVISHPGQRERVDVNTPTSCVDVLPTLCHVSGLPVPGWSEGRILPTFSDGALDEDRSVYSMDAKTNPRIAPYTKGTVAMIKGPYKLINYFGYANYPGAYELYDLENDPEELEDLFEARSSLAGELSEELHARLEAVNQPYRRA